MFRMTKRLRRSFACTQTMLGNPRKRYIRRGLVAHRILSLAALLVAILLRSGCQSEKNSTPGFRIGPPLPATVSGTPVQQLPSLPSIDPENGERGLGSPSLALGPQVIYFNGQMYGPMIDESRDSFRDENVQAQIVPPDISGSYPLWQNDRNEWTTSAKVCDSLLPPHAIFIDRQQSSPDERWNVGLNTTYRHLLEKGWIDGGGVSVESVSEKPFSSLSQVTEGVSVFLKVPHGPHDFWLFSVSYSRSNEWSWPIPQVAYTWQPSGRVQANIGIVPSRTDHPLDDLSLGVSIKLLSPAEP